MNKISLEEYKEYVKQNRATWFDSPYELVYRCFVAEGFTKEDRSYFRENASEIVERLRKKAWEMYLPHEREFTAKMLLALMKGNDLSGTSAEEAIVWYVDSFAEYIYALTLSNTQSRRSRAGKEFESIIELLLMGAGVPLDSQGNIGKQAFVQKGLGKLVDVVSPGVVEFAIDKSDTVLISAKTTLRERWQEVPEEMGRTGAREMFLVTLDNVISDEVLATLYEANIRVVTTKNIKETYYSSNKRVLDFEKLIDICLANSHQWDSFEYDAVHIGQISSMINGQAEKHAGHDFVVKYYLERMEKLQ